MSKETLKWIISASVVLVLTVALVVLSSTFSLKSELSKYFGANVNLENGREVSELKDIEGKRYVVAHDKKDYVVFSVIANHKYGQIDFWIVIKSDGKADAVIEKIVEVNNDRDFISKTYYYASKVLMNTDYKKLKSATPTITGSTTSLSNGAIQNAMLQVLKYNFKIVDDPYIDIFGEDYNAVLDTDFVPQNDGVKNVHSRATVTVGSDVWEIYRISNSSWYDSTDKTKNGKVVFELVFDKDGKIVCHKLIKKEDLTDTDDQDLYYSQSDGYMVYVDEYISKMYGKTLEEALTVDLESGATDSGLRSKTCVKGAIEYLDLVLKGA